LAFQTDGAAQSVVGKARSRKSLKRAEISLIVSIAFLCGVLFYSIHDYAQVLNNKDVILIGITGGSLMLRKTAITRMAIPSFF